MRDKLTNKRIKVDYLLVLKVVNMEDEFLSWCQKKTSKISFNRLAYAFCQHKKIDVDQIYWSCLSRGVRTYDEYMKELTRIANTPWIDED